LNTIARSRVSTKLIVRNWDDLLRVAGSLHQGTVSASKLMRSFLRAKRPPTLARAIGALGRIPKTLYMLACVDDEGYRRWRIANCVRYAIPLSSVTMRSGK
jgi:TnpA family transposase